MEMIDSINVEKFNDAMVVTVKDLVSSTATDNRFALKKKLNASI